MSDWSDEEYFKLLGVVPNHQKFPDQVMQSPRNDVENGQNQDVFSQDKHTDRQFGDLDNSFVAVSESMRQNYLVGNDRISAATEFDDDILNVQTSIQNRLGKMQEVKVQQPEFKKNGYYFESSWTDSELKMVTPVKDQGKTCGASYAFAIIAALEAA